MTTTTTETETQVAQQLFTAYQTQHALTMADFTSSVVDEDAAYRVQAALTALKQQPVGGYKVSLTSAETQKMFDAHTRCTVSRLRITFWRHQPRFDAGN